MRGSAGGCTQLIQFVLDADTIPELDTQFYTHRFPNAHAHAVCRRSEVFAVLHGGPRLPDHGHRLQGSLGNPV